MLGRMEVDVGMLAYPSGSRTPLDAIVVVLLPLLIGKIGKAARGKSELEILILCLQKFCRCGGVSCSLLLGALEVSWLWMVREGCRSGMVKKT